MNILFASTKKHRQFDLQSRLGEFSQLKNKDDKRIEFARMPRKRLKSLWWLVLFFAVMFYFFIYLNSI